MLGGPVSQEISYQKFQEISCQKFQKLPVSSFQLVKKFPAFHWTQSLSYHIHKNVPLNRIMNHEHAVHIFIISFIRSILILSYNLCPIFHKLSPP